MLFAICGRCFLKLRFPLQVRDFLLHVHMYIATMESIQLLVVCVCVCVCMCVCAWCVCVWVDTCNCSL